jgi:hypothetical protein
MTTGLVVWLHNAFLVAAVVVFILHAWNFPARPNLVGLGLAFLTIAWLLVGIGGVPVVVR